MKQYEFTSLNVKQYEFTSLSAASKWRPIEALSQDAASSDLHSNEILCIRFFRERVKSEII